MAALLVLSLLVLWAFGSGCGGSGDAGTGTPEDSKAAATTSLGSGPTEAVLGAVDGSDASGTVLLLKQSSTSSLFKVKLEGLRPSSGGGQYVLWLMASRHAMVPLFTYPADKDGVLAQEWEPNPLHVGFIEDGSKTEFLVTRTDTTADQQRSLDGGETAYDPPFIGTPVLRGTFKGPLVGSKEGE